VSQTRRLAAILAADVAGYSRLMGTDEEGTHETLKAHLAELVDPKIVEHRGRIVKNTGDGFLAEFPSVVDAVRCAVEIQRGMPDREPEVPKERRIRFRIGINLGDVIVEEHDIFGDGVNVAARIEGLAEPGGICVSRVVRDQVRDRLDYAFEDRGDQSVKNIARPVRVYALLVEALSAPQTARVPTIFPRLGWRGAVVALAVAAMIVTTAIAWWVWSAPWATSVPTAAVTGAGAISFAPPPVAPRLSIVVLPFNNLSNDPDQQYFADGITEDLTTDLSRIPDMLVISRNSAFTYKDNPVNAKRIGRELGVRYALEGSVQRSGEQVRVNAQLIDAENDAHLWGGRFDRTMDDLLVLQDEITSRIAKDLGVALISREAARPSERPDTLDYILQGRAALINALMKPPSRDNYVEAAELFEHALALDPQSVEAKSGLAVVLSIRVINGMAGSKATDLVRADSLADEVLAALPRSAPIHAVKGTVLRAQHRCEQVIAEFETALASDRNLVFALYGLALCKLLTGSIDEMIPLAEQAIRVSPRDPSIGWWYFWIGTVHLLKSRIEEAVVWFEKGRSVMPGVANFHARLAAAYALSGEEERAAAELTEARRLNGDIYSSLARVETGGDWGVPKVRALFEATYFAGLRKAGMPEE
jgi:adenylate cyclase